MKSRIIYIFILIFYNFFHAIYSLDYFKSLKERHDLLMENFDIFTAPIEFQKSFTPNNVYMLPAICVEDIEELLAVYNSKQAAQFFDAWAKLPAGLLYGQRHSFGNFDECQNAEMFSFKLNRTIQGKYTYVYAWIQRSNKIKHLLNIGICLPETCPSRRILNFFSNTFNTTTKFAAFFNTKLKYESNNITDESSPVIYAFVNEKNISSNVYFTAYLGVFFLILFGVLVTLSTTYEYIVLKKSNVPPNLLFKSFSAISILKFIFKMETARETTTTTKRIDCIDGIRCLNLIWNIFGHTYLWSYPMGDSNTFDRVAWAKQLFSRILIAANANVDTWLLLSGFLITWIGLHKIEKDNRRLNIKQMYLHRFLRLTPAFAATLLFAAGLFVFVGDGPVWHRFVYDTVQTCQRSWWKSLFYVANYVDINDMCMGHSWYLATDMQLYLLAPFILKALHKWQKSVIWCLIAMITLSCYWTFSNIIDSEHGGFVFDSMILGENMNLKVAYSAHMRMGPWLVGVIGAYLLFQQQNDIKKMSLLKITLGWLIAITFIVLVIFGPDARGVGKEATILEAALYESLGRCTWSIAIAWLIFSCHMGYSKTMNDFLSHSFWQPLARLNYSIYLVKTFINIKNLGLQKTASHFSNFEMMGQFWSDFGLSAMFALLLSLMIEFPFLNLENYFLNKRQKVKVLL